MVVHHVEEHLQAQPVRRVDQGLQLVGRAVGRVRRIRQHAVVAPVVRCRGIGRSASARSPSRPARPAAAVARARRRSRRTRRRAARTAPSRAMAGPATPGAATRSCAGPRPGSHRARRRPAGGRPGRGTPCRPACGSGSASRPLPAGPPYANRHRRAVHRVIDAVQLEHQRRSTEGAQIRNVAALAVQRSRRTEESWAIPFGHATSPRGVTPQQGQWSPAAAASASSEAGRSWLGDRPGQDCRRRCRRCRRRITAASVFTTSRHVPALRRADADIRNVARA